MAIRIIPEINDSASLSEDPSGAADYTVLGATSAYNACELLRDWLVTNSLVNIGALTLKNIHAENKKSRDVDGYYAYRCNVTYGAFQRKEPEQPTTDEPDIHEEE